MLLGWYCCQTRPMLRLKPLSVDHFNQHRMIAVRLSPQSQSLVHNPLSGDAHNLERILGKPETMVV